MPPLIDDKKKEKCSDKLNHHYCRSLMASDERQWHVGTIVQTAHLFVIYGRDEALVIFVIAADDDWSNYCEAAAGEN